MQQYKIHLPLSTLLPRKTNKPRPPKAPPQSQPTKVGGYNTTTIQYELLILDTMHDLIGTNIYTIFKIFKNEFDIPKNLKDSFMKSNYSFTREAAQYIQTKARIPALQNTTFNNETKKAYDANLAAAISQWTNLKFVLDNFVAGLYGGPMSQGVMIILGCAYLIVLLSNMKHLGMLKASRPQSVTFYDGFFMMLDGKYISRFYTLFCKTIKRLTHFDTFVRPIVEFSQILQPTSFNRLFPEAQATMSRNDIQIRGQTFSIFPKNPLPNTIYYPHTKEEFLHHVKKNPKEKTLWYLNFLRDAFKADVALETNSIFVTHDRLAHTYYKLAGGKMGFLISLNLTIDSQQTQHCEYDVAF